jgi:serine protease Do
MTSVEISAQSRMLVIIVKQEPGRPLREVSLQNSPIGAAALLMADENGYLLATNRHVAEPPIPFLTNRSERVLVVSNQGSYAYADVIARHRDLDLALLWIARRTGRARFRQPITRYADLVVGSSAYVIGHPQRLFFTLSSGLVSRVGGDGTIQLSAPISPGNSGGPAYDAFGNLLGLVTFTFDKQTDPNAENLNFATRADAFLTEAGWTFQGDGKGRLKDFFQQNPNREK